VGAGAVPNNMDALAFAQGNLTAAHAACRASGTRPTVNPNRLRETPLARLPSDIKEVPGGCVVAFEINQVESALGVHDSLGLNAKQAERHGVPITLEILVQ